MPCCRIYRRQERDIYFNYKKSFPRIEASYGKEEIPLKKPVCLRTVAIDGDPGFCFLISEILSRDTAPRNKKSYSS
jgi:hypothetical protein